MSTGIYQANFRTFSLTEATIYTLLFATSSLYHLHISGSGIATGFSLIGFGVALWQAGQYKVCLDGGVEVVEREST